MVLSWLVLVGPRFLIRARINGASEKKYFAMLCIDLNSSILYRTYFHLGLYFSA